MNKRIVSNTPRQKLNNSFKDSSFIEESKKKERRNNSNRKSLDFSLNDITNHSLIPRKNSVSKLSNKPQIDSLNSPSKSNIPILKKKFSHQNINVNKNINVVRERDLSASRAKKTIQMKERSVTRNKERSLIQVKERSVSRNKERSLSKAKTLKPNTKDTQNADQMSMTITNQFGVTSTIMKMSIKKPVPKSSLRKTKVTKSEVKKKENCEKTKTLEGIVENKDNDINSESFIDRKIMNFNEKTKELTKKNHNKKIVTYEVKNLNTIKGTGAQIGLIVKKEHMTKNLIKASPVKRESVSNHLKLDDKKLEKLETLKKKLNKLEIITDNTLTQTENRTNCRLENMDFTVFSTPRNNKFEPILNDRLLFTDYNSNRFSKIKIDENLRESRVENISKLLETHHNHVSGESAATSSDSFKRESRKLLNNNNKI